jgi:hypothetical protein
VDELNAAIKRRRQAPSKAENARDDFASVNGLR